MSIILFVSGLIIGGVGMFLIMRNNPRYLNIDGMAKDKLQALVDKIKTIL